MTKGGDPPGDRTVDADGVGGEATEGDDRAGTDADAGGVEAYTTDRRTLSPRVRVLWWSRVLVGAAVLGVVAALLAPRLGLAGPVGPVLGSAVGLLGLAWVVLRYRLWGYEVRADALFLERGVVTHRKTLAPYVRVQHVDTSRGPIERALGLSTLVVYTAGSRGADVSVPGLTEAEAADLQDRLKELAIEAEGGDAV